MIKATTMTRDWIAEVRQYNRDIANSAIVLSSAAALILAGQPLPF
ncbi:MAG: hypothetical protein ABJN35_11890 [Erythrobacter sp.]